MHTVSAAAALQYRSKRFVKRCYRTVGSKSIVVVIATNSFLFQLLFSGRAAVSSAGPPTGEGGSRRAGRGGTRRTRMDLREEISAPTPPSPRRCPRCPHCNRLSCGVHKVPFYPGRIYVCTSKPGAVQLKARSTPCWAGTGAGVGWGSLGLTDERPPHHPGPPSTLV